MASNKKTYTVRPEQVLSNVKGWLTLQLSDGSTVKVRKSQVRVIEGGISNRRIGDRRHDCSAYVRRVGGKLLKSAGGHSTMDNGDALAKQLRGADLEEVYKQASKLLGESVTELKARYAKLNPGMQRMNLGNRMRAAADVE